ncbi:MAG: type II CAAX prenyl endopeptidase Rce1 family protein [Novosphingobium sp.]
MTALLRDFAAYLARPRLVTPSGLGAPGAWRTLLALLGFHLAVLLGVLAPLLQLWQSAMGLPAPEAFGAVSKGWLVPMVVLIAPLAEECAFRSWLTGRPRTLWLMACGLVTGVFLAMVNFHVAEVPASFAVLAMGLVAPGGWWLLRRRGAPRWFGAAFPGLFVFSIVVFGLSHLSNYPRISLALLPMILPQIWAGIVLSYARMRIGLAASMLIHGAANAAAISLALLAH